MNLKERGITVGDLLLIIVFTLMTIFIVNAFKDNDKKSNFHIIPNNLSKSLIS